jgi:hypothetical protein
MEQDAALGIMLGGGNCFLTGAAGAGKTFVLNQFIRLSKALGRKVAVTASTGIAATHLGGNTIHSWSGIGTRDSLNNWFFDKIPKSRRATIESANTLIIDEISMLHDYYLDLVDEVCRRVRHNLTIPFGGLQVIVCGDFFQLPPVSRNRQANFVYNSRVWKEASFQVLYLTEQHRQDDSDYLQILSAIRSADYRRHHIESLLSRIGAKLTGDVTQLHTHNWSVDTINHQKLQEVAGTEQAYLFEYSGNKTYWEKLIKNILAPEILRLKIGSLVMAVKNVPEKGFWNGSIGEVVDLSFNGFPVVKFRSGKTIEVAPEEWDLIDGDIHRATISQIPLRLAWAITVHKSQGMTLDAARVDLRHAFEPGMGYVALSRVKSLEGLSLDGINKTAITVNPDVLARDKIFRADSEEIAKKLGAQAAETLATASAKLEAKQKKSKQKTSVSTEIEATEKTPSQERWAKRVAKEREKWPNARKPWTLADSLLLVEYYLKGKTVTELSEHFGRKPRSIMMRLNESFDTEIFTEEDGI